jgi:PAS domain S-box-containing protein
MKLKLSENILTGFFIISVFLLVFIASVSYRQFLAFENKQAEMYQEFISFEDTLMELLEALSGMEGLFYYPLGEGSAFSLDEFEYRKRRINHLVEELYAKPTLRGPSVELLDQLNASIQVRTQQLDRLFYENEVPDSAVWVRSGMEGKLFMRRFVDRVNGIGRHQNRVWSGLLFDQPGFYHISPLVSLGTVFFSIVVFSMAYFKIYHDLKKNSRTSNQLQINNEIFKQAEEISSSGHWYYNSRTASLTFSDNQYRLLGYEPGEVIPSLKTFLDAVVKEERGPVNKALRKLRSNQKSEPLDIKIRAPGGEEKCLRTIGRLIIDENGHKIFVGSSKDITKELEAEEKLYLLNHNLAVQNMKLNRSNQELASFNHVVSHDLQEPLRKIQTFVSRINAMTELEALPAAKEYFFKIKRSAGRMQQLIKDLLAFSKASKAEKLFEEASLQELLESALSELAPDIEEKSAKVVYDNLPTARVIPFQMKQLFLNLLGNALKYAKEGIQPLIAIKV